MPVVAPASLSPSPTPALLTVDQAAGAYRTIAGAYNKAITAAFKKYGKSTTLKANKAYWAVSAKAGDTFIDALKAVKFPADVQADATKLIKSSIVAQRAALAASKAKNWAQLNERAADAIKADKKSVELVAILRDDLGLPPNV